MGKTVLYLAISVDGYIADEQGGVNWLGGDGSQPDTLGNYPEFYERMDTIVMGWITYHQLVTELSPDSWPYQSRPCYAVKRDMEIRKVETDKKQHMVLLLLADEQEDMVHLNRAL